MSNPDDGIKDEEAARSLLQAAKHIFDERFGRAGELEAELAHLDQQQFGPQKRKLELKTKIKAYSVHMQRLGSYVPLLGGEFKCPQCWLRNETAVTLDERHVGHYRFSFDSEFHCPRCRQVFAV